MRGTPFKGRSENVWSFDLRQMENLQRNIRAWNFLVGLVRDDGGSLGSPKTGVGSRLRIPTEVQINAVYTEPRSEEGHEQFGIALDGWEKLNVKAIPAVRYDAVLEEAEALV